MNTKQIFWTFYLNVRHFRAKQRFKQAIGNFPKLIEVVISCTTTYQCNSALQYLALYIAKSHADGLDHDSPFGIVNREILGRVAEYLQDTRHHSAYNLHYRNGNMNSHWPDLNCYLNDLLSIKFAKSWKRGKSSVSL